MNIFLFITIILSFLTLINRIYKLYHLVQSKKYIPAEHPDEKAKSEKVAIHVPISNEPPGLVLKTLESLSRISYSDYRVFVLDNNTKNRDKWLPVMLYCEKNSALFTFYHEEKLADYKAGALNYLLERTPPDYGYIAIVDSDNIVKPGFLTELIPYLKNEKVAFIQTPLGFKDNPENYRFISWIFLIYRYYLSVYMPSLANKDHAPFIGSMGIIKRKCLEHAGGWDGKYLTEDMEISYRLFSKGFQSVFYNKHLGSSMPPDNIKSFKQQHFRWNFGNSQILRDHFFKKKKFRYSYLYFSSPGIYLNIYLLPFFLTVFIFSVLKVFYHSATEPVTLLIIISVLAIEIFSDILGFYKISKRERTGKIYCIKNIVSWFGLAVNNTLSTYYAFIKKSIPFVITEKGVSSKKRRFQPEYITAAITLVILLTVNDLFIRTAALLLLIFPVCFIIVTLVNTDNHDDTQTK